MDGVIIKLYPLNKKVITEDMYIFDDFVYEYNQFIESNIWMLTNEIKAHIAKLKLIAGTDPKDDVNIAIKIYQYLLKKMIEQNDTLGMIQYL